MVCWLFELESSTQANERKGVDKIIREEKGLRDRNSDSKGEKVNKSQVVLFFKIQ